MPMFCRAAVVCVAVRKRDKFLLTVNLSEVLQLTSY